MSTQQKIFQGTGQTSSNVSNSIVSSNNVSGIGGVVPNNTSANQQNGGSPGAVSDVTSSLSNNNLMSTLLNHISLYGPIVIGIVGANLLIRIAICFIMLKMCMSTGVAIVTGKCGYMPINDRDHN